MPHSWKLKSKPCNFLFPFQNTSMHILYLGSKWNPKGEIVCLDACRFPKRAPKVLDSHRAEEISSRWSHLLWSCQTFGRECLCPYACVRAEVRVHGWGFWRTWMGRSARLQGSIVCLLRSVCAHDFPILGTAVFISLLGRGDFAPVSLGAREPGCLSVCWTGVSQCRWLWFRISLSMSVGVHVCLSVRVSVSTRLCFRM